MRKNIIVFLKKHPMILNFFWKFLGIILKVWSVFVPIKEKTVLFASFGGRKFDDSPRALYEEMLKRPEFSDWKFIWAFVEPEKFDISNGDKVKIDTYSFFKILISSRVWISNSGMTRGIDFKRNGIIYIETWHGTPLKKIGGEENTNSMIYKKSKRNVGNLDSETIRCAQSEYDREIFQRIFNATKDSIILSDLPRNDSMLIYTYEKVQSIRKELSIPCDKKVLLYTPTYREYLINENNNMYIAPPINLEKWERALGDEYVLLIRAHYAIAEALGLQNTKFVRDVSEYSPLNDLYAVADCMISDYSSTYFDYSILERPMFCFAYDLEEYEKKRGLYLKLQDTLPCPIDKDEDDVVYHILNMDRSEYVENTKKFHEKYTPYAGNACGIIIDEILRRLES